MLILLIFFNLPLIGEIYSNNHLICASKGSHLKLAKALSIIFSIISVYSCAEKSKEVGCGDLMECETIEVMEFGVRGGVTGVEFL